MFVAEHNPKLAHASALMYDDPIGHRAEIESAVRRHFLVRTRADVRLRRDPRRRRAALASGAHFISSDFADPRFRWLDLGWTVPGRCNPLSASGRCTLLALAERVGGAVAALAPLP